MDFFYRTFFFFGYILTVNTSSHVPVLNFEEKNWVIQNAIITWTDIFLEHVYFVFSILASENNCQINKVPIWWYAIPLENYHSVSQRWSA